ncbi:MAG: hypothetical protein AAGG38_13325 [Planctomycetota bacterium]
MVHRGLIGTAGVAGALTLGSGLGGCTTSVVQARIDQPLPVHLEMAMSSGQPTFGVGDELGWLAFGDLAIAPMPGEPREVLVIASVEPAGFDVVSRYLTGPAAE